MANRTVSVALVADVGQYQSAMVRAASTTQSVGDSATTAGTKAQRGLEAAGRGAALLTAALTGGLVLGLKGAVNAAADAEQSIGGVQAVFKDYADTVIADSKEADRALGLAANSYRELATVIGAQLKNAGVPMDELAEKTDGLITMGADLAAMFGGTTEEAVRALSSALKGEMDPIEAYGISLNDAALKAEAAALGLEVMDGTLTTSQRAMAVMSAVTKQGTDAIGAFGREQDTAAGRAQRAAASWENLKVAVGDRLLPAWSALVDVLGTKVIPALDGVLETGGDVVRFIEEHKELALALAGVLAVQLAGGITAVTIAFNRMVLTPAVLGLVGLMDVVLNLPAAFAAARTAVATFVASVAPLAAVGAVVYGITKLVDFASAAGDARAEIADMWDAVEDARGAEQITGTADMVDQLRAKIRTLRDEIDEGMFFVGNPFEMADMATASKQLEEYEAALIKAEKAQGMVSASTDVMSRRFGLTRDQVLDLASKYDIDLTGAMSETFRLMQNYYAMEFGAKPTEATIAVADAFEDAKTAVDEAKDAVDMFKLSLDILTGAHVSMIEVESAFEAAIDAADGALKDLNGSVLNAAGGLNMQTESGRAAADVLLDVRDSGHQLIATMIQQGDSADEVRAKDAELRESFIRTAEQMGISRADAERLTDQILGIPAERETKIDADVQAARDKIAATQADIDNMQGRTITIGVRASAPANFSQQAGRLYVGVVPEFDVGGYTGHGHKKQPAGIVHKGEVVWSQEDVAAHGGPARVDSMRRARVGYDRGGPVGIDVHADGTLLDGDLRNLIRTATDAVTASRTAGGGAAGGGAVGGTWQSLFAMVKAAFPLARVNSAFRPGDPGYHGRGKAVDLGWGSLSGGSGNAGLAAMDRWFYINHGSKLAELIYTGIGNSTPDIKNGRPLDYGPATNAAHRNHVHVATYDQGGWLHPGLTMAYNGTGAPERVLTSREFSSTSGGGSAPAIDYALLTAALQQARPVHFYTPDVPHAIRAFEAHQRQQTALAPAW